jgi:hypothetical protein
MTRTGDTEREVIRIAAESASKLLPKLRQEQQRLEDRVARLQAVVAAWEAVSGKRVRSDAIGESENTGEIRVRAKKGQVPAHIEQVLQDGQEYAEPELRKAIEERFGVKYERATVYTSLRRGLKDHKYQHQGKKWSLNPLKLTNAA